MKTTANFVTHVGALVFLGTFTGGYEMYTNVNLAAPIGAMAFLGTGLLFLIAAVIFLYTVIKGELAGSKFVLATTAIITSIYIGAILFFSFTSQETVLARGQEKHFCEIDCHLAYSVLDVQRTQAVGTGGNQATAQGLFHIVTVRTRFDENTISSTRGNGELKPNSRIATIIDEHGTRYAPSAAGETALANSENKGTPLTTALRPGESYTTKLVFDLPQDVTNPTLLINEGKWLTHFLIGHENSPLHKKTRFQL